MSDEYFVEWNSGRNEVILIYKKVRQAIFDDIKNGFSINYLHPSRTRFYEAKEKWFVVDLIYSHFDVGLNKPYLARIDLKRDWWLDIVTYEQAVAMML